MGSTSSKNRLYCESLSTFSDEEKLSIQKLYTSISVEKNGFTSSHLAAYNGKKFPKVFSDKVFRASLLVLGSKPISAVDLSIFARVLAVLLKGDPGETGQFLLNMKGPVAESTNEMLKQFLREICVQFLSLVQTTASFQTWNFQRPQDVQERLLQMLYFDLLCKRKNVHDFWKSSEVVFSENELQQMFFTESLLTKAFKLISTEMFPVLENRRSNLIPECVESDQKESSALLDLASVVLINQSLPVHLRSCWKLLYSTSLHGHSFSMMLGRLIQKGPSIIVLKDKEGHIFGGFSSQHWEMKPTFTGKEDTFVFTLSPNLAVYSSTGYNANFTYLCLHQHTLPNGLGFGGQLNNFGLWLDSEFEGGHSTPACSTFSSPQLSGSRHFKLEELQVWAVGPPVDNPDTNVVKKSILDADVGAKAILTMVNKVGASDGIREEDEQLEKEAVLKEM